MSVIKHEIRIPTTQYGYISIFLEGVSTEEAIEEHNEAIRKYNESLQSNNNQGLSSVEWNKALDNYLSSQNVDVEYFERMSERQSRMFQELKKAFARIKNKHGYKD